MYWSRILVVVSMGMAACSQPSVQGSQALTPVGEAGIDDEVAIRARLNFQPVRWPLKFKVHSFGARCYDTLSCKIWYAGVDEGDTKPSPPSSNYGPDYLDGWQGGLVGIRNFPHSAEVTWITNDGKRHHVDVDIANIFRDELVLHSIPRDEVDDMPNGANDLTVPFILLEVNGPTIRVYMRALVPTRHLRTPGNPNSDYRADLILVKTYNY